MFNAPIPGESLMREPGNAPWEQPPQFPTVQESLTFYMDKFDDDETLEDALFILDQDFPLDLLVESILMYGEMEGKHTSDVSFLIGPVLHEHLLSMASAAGVTVREFQGETKSEKQKQKIIKDLQIVLGDDRYTSDIAIELKSTVKEAVTNDVQIQLPASKAKKGLISRKV